jgi:hypothetical protein
MLPGGKWHVKQNCEVVKYFCVQFPGRVIANEVFCLVAGESFFEINEFFASHKGGIYLQRAPSESDSDDTAPASASQLLHGPPQRPVVVVWQENLGNPSYRLSFFDLTHLTQPLIRVSN